MVRNEGDHVRPEREGQGAKGAQEDHCDRKKGHFIPTVLYTEREQNCRHCTNHGEYKQIRTLDPHIHHLEMFGQRLKKDDNQKYEQPDREIR